MKNSGKELLKDCEAKIKPNTIRITFDYCCKNCGWPIIDACCNGEFANYKDASEWDWWQYCSNKGCKNHEGEGISQEKASFIKQEKK